MSNKFSILSTLVACLVLGACGGGGDSGGGGETPAAVVPITSLSGTAAVGAKLVSATITVYDSKGSVVGTTTTDANGQYTLAVGSQYVAPYTVRVDGTVGDAAATLYSVATSPIANVNQLTNAIASALVASGNPAELVSGTSATASTIGKAESAYTSLLAKSISSVSAPSTFIGSTFDSNYDTLLDNVSATVYPTGNVVISTSAGMQSDDLGDGATPSSSLSFTTAIAGALPTGTLPSLSKGALLSTADLEFLRNKIQTCFNTPSASRGTVASPISACQGLDAASGGEVFSHNGQYWLDTTSACTSSSAYCQGVFGYMLTQSKYDGLLFGQPQILRSLNDTTWIVKFPITFNNSSDATYGTVDNFGEDVFNGYMVIRKYPKLISGSDTGWRFYGDQRVVSSFIEPVAQRVYLISGNPPYPYRYETGLNIYVNGNSLRSFGNAATQDAVYVTSVVVTGKGLPSGGITLFNKGTKGTSSGGKVTWSNSCGGYAILSATLAELTTNSLVTCAGVIRLAYAGDLSPTAGSPAFLPYWGSQSLTDAQIDALAPDPKKPMDAYYQFAITLSNGTVVKHTNALSKAPLNTETLKKAIVTYPTFTTATETALKAFTGQSASFTVAWEKMTTPTPVSAAIYWSKGTKSTTQGVSLANIAASSVSVPCTGTCTTASNWTDGLNGSISDLGMAQIRSRDREGGLVFSIIRLY